MEVSSGIKLDGAFDQAPIAMGLVGLDGAERGRYVEVNAALCELSGYPAAELLGSEPRAHLHPADAEEDARAVERLIAGDAKSYEREQRWLAPDRRVIWVLLTASLVRDADGEPFYWLRQAQDIDQRKRFEGQLEFLARHDALTGLFNRYSFDRAISRELALARRYGGSGAVLMMDIDNLKLVNDTLGHSAGDEVIANVAHLLTERLRETDVLARVGGDEFAALLARIDREQAEEVATSLVAVVREGSFLAGVERSLPVTLSVGVASYAGEDPTNAADLMIDADVAMYEAKHAGRDRVALSRAGAEGRVRTRVSWSERIRAALEEELFVLHAQPILDLETDVVTQHELLLRMPGEAGELLLPGSFLYDAERFGLIGEIDLWVTTQAIELLASDPGLGRIEVNISGQSTVDPEFPGHVKHELDRCRVDASRLIFEIAETTAITNMQRARRFTSQLAAIGCGFALDDFGSGFGSFYYLKYLPFDFVKIDGEYIEHLSASETDLLIVRAIVEIVRGLGKRTIAEFVGDARTVELLRSEGVDYAQGNHVGQPRPFAEAFASFASGR